MTYAVGTTITSPWWGVPLVAGVFALVGVITGQMLTWALDVRRGNREDSRRWHAERRLLYPSFIASVEASHRKIMNMLAGEAEMNFGDLEPLLDAAMNVRAEIQIIASKAVCEVAEQVIMALVFLAINGTDPEYKDHGLEEMSATVDGTVDDLTKAIRRELGVDR